MERGLSVVFLGRTRKHGASNMLQVILLKGLHYRTIPSAAQLEMGEAGHPVCANLNVFSRWVFYRGNQAAMQTCWAGHGDRPQAEFKKEVDNIKILPSRSSHFPFLPGTTDFLQKPLL